MSDPLQDYRDRVHMPQDVRDRHDAYDKEHSMTEPDGPVVTPEEVAASAPDEADDAAYDIHPAADPDLQDELDGIDEELEPTCLTAFLVIIGPDGAAFGTSDLTKIAEVVPAREAQIADMRRACQEVVHDINAIQMSGQAAQQTVMLMEQRAQEMAEQTQQQKMAQALMKKGITVPGRGR